MVWIPSHVGITGNERADFIAKQSLGHIYIDQPSNLEYKETYELINRYITAKWQEHWNDSTTGGFYRSVEPIVNSKIKLKNINRRKEVTLTRLRLGKTRLNHNLRNIGCHPSGLCDTCQVDESVEHYLLNCSESAINETLNNICTNRNLTFDLISILSNIKVLEEIYPLVKRQL